MGEVFSKLPHRMRAPHRRHLPRLIHVRLVLHHLQEEGQRNHVHRPRHLPNAQPHSVTGNPRPPRPPATPPLRPPASPNHRGQHKSVDRPRHLHEAGGCKL